MSAQVASHNGAEEEFIEERQKDSEGRIFTKKYIKGRLLGKGGFAKVFLAHSLPNKTPYAFKIVQKSSLVKDRARRKLRTEISIHRSLNHTNVVRFHHFFEDEINAYLVMELCERQSMSELLKRRQKLTDPEIRFYNLQLINGLEYLHKHLIIHRDLKLGNLFISAGMKLKIGDFGLATKLTSPDERRRTVCGTPNYIAPEILEGKDGHSFEVDVWSTGVIIYTLLVGKPPFESKDVKSTYKRILANSYAFPSSHPVGNDVKSLIRLMLQNRAEERPSLNAILDHPFFSRPSNFTPLSLPESALREPYVYSSSSVTQACTVSQQIFSDPIPIGAATTAYNTGTTSSSSSAQTNGKLTLQPPQREANNENDPGAINRQPSQSTIQLHMKASTAKPLTSASSTIAASSNQPSQKSSNYTFVPSSRMTTRSARNADIMPPTAPSGASALNNPVAVNPPAPPAASVASQPSAVMRVNSALAFTSNHPSSLSSMQQQQSSQHQPPVSRSIVQRTKTSDSASSTAAAAAGLLVHSRNHSPTRKHKDLHVDINQMQKDLQNVNIAESNMMQGETTAASSSSSSSRSAKYAAASSGDSSNGYSNNGWLSNWEDNRRESFPPSTTVPIPVLSTVTTEASMAAATNFAQFGQPSSLSSNAPSKKSSSGSAFVNNLLEKENYSSAATATVSASSSASVSSSSKNNSMPIIPSTASIASAAQATGEALAALQKDTDRQKLQTPPDAVRSSREAQKAQIAQGLGTLETMHTMLNNSYSMVDAVAAKGKEDGSAAAPTATAVTTSETAAVAAPISGNGKPVNNVWVVRYVDYTSKYGLGFLFNTGSAGVYFNDSTKIVLSPDGKVFQYIERKRKDSSSSSEHSSQTHLLSSYPHELQKKVTLLKHFRNYLVDQQRSSEAAAGTAPSAAEFNTNSAAGLPTAAGSDGACADVKYGESSVKYSAVCPTATEEKGDDNVVVAGDGEMSLDGDDEDDAAASAEEMPFLKKWVRTKHAILFRISNRTVQIVFYDRSEVLLSSEARMVTYVNKQGQRSEHSLDEVLSSGRVDIAKRLKYTKDIMYRLINTQPR